MSDLVTWQKEVAVWHRRNFPDSGRLAGGLAVAEESGELCRAILKQFTGTRGTYEEWDREIATEIADVIIAATWVASLLEMDVGVLINERWKQISQRDWVANPNGHGLPR